MQKKPVMKRFVHSWVWHHLRRIQNFVSSQLFQKLIRNAKQHFKRLFPLNPN